jgi:hypothetical protein
MYPMDSFSLVVVRVFGQLSAEQAAARRSAGEPDGASRRARGAGSRMQDRPWC